MDRADDHRRRNLTLLEMANLFNLPQNITERVSEMPVVSSPSGQLVELERPAPPEVKTTDTSRFIDDMRSSIGRMEGRMDRIEIRRSEIRNELRSLTRAIDLERSRMLRRDLERPYPVSGVFTVGFLIALVGILILFPFQLPSFAQFLFGIGFLLIGISVSMESLTHIGQKTIRPER